MIVFMLIIYATTVARSLIDFSVEKTLSSLITAVLFIVAYYILINHFVTLNG